jgi:hypothetical protein
MVYSITPRHRNHRSCTRTTAEERSGMSLEAMMQTIPLPPYKHKKPGQESHPGLIGKVKRGLLHRLQQPLLQPAVIDSQLRDADQDGAGGDSMTCIGG